MVAPRSADLIEIIMKISDFENMVKEKPMKSSKISVRNGLSSGSTMLNLACSGNPLVCFLKGKYYFFVGDSASGKTFFCLTCLAEASRSAAFKKYRFIYDNSEDGALMDMGRFFGEKMANRLEAPSYFEDGDPAYSQTIEEFYYNVDDAIGIAQEDERPFIYIMDSMDSLTSSEEAGKFDEHKKAHRKGTAAPGSYGDGKAKKNSSNLRRLLGPLKETGSILIIINQTRDSLGFGFEKKTRSGGHSLRFYACLEMWSSVVGKITRTIKKKKRQIGVKCRIKIKKNRLTGQEHEVDVPIYHSYGIDDVESCIDYLVSENVWSKDKSGKIRAKEFNMVGSAQQLARKIEEKKLQKDLQLLVGEVWDSIQVATRLKRTPRYE